MSQTADKIVQYLSEAHATEVAIVTTLRTHIAITPSGAYRLILDRHLDETQAQARRIERRLDELGAGRGVVGVSRLTLQNVIGQWLAITKSPIDLLRGGSGEEKLLKNAKDECATEALEIATYDALEAVAREVGDERTAELAVEHRAQEERMLARLREQIPKLAHAMVESEIYDDPSYDPSKTGAAQVARAVRDDARERVEDVAGEARSTAAGVASRAGGAVGGVASRAAGVAGPALAAARGMVPGGGGGNGGESVHEGAVDATEVPIPDYDSLRVADILGRLPELTQAELSEVDAYERRGRARRTVLAKIDSLRSLEPWEGYDEASLSEIDRHLAEAGPEAAERVRDYERRHRARTDVMAAAGRRAARG